MKEQVILDIIQRIEPQLFWLFLKFIGVGVVLLVMKGYIESIAAYVQFRLQKKLGQDSRVRVRGKEGKIIDYNFSWIFVRTDDSVEIISMKRWRFEKWAVVNGD